MVLKDDMINLMNEKYRFSVRVNRENGRSRSF